MTFTPNQGLDIPDGTDNANVPLSFTNYNTGVESRLVERYLSIADRTARNAAPFEGELSYLADLNRYDTYTGAAWIALIPSFATSNDATFYNSVSLGYTTAGAAIVGAAIVVPPSGAVRVDWTALISNSAAQSTLVAPQLNDGAVVGAGAVLSGVTDTFSIATQQTQIQTSSFRYYTGLVAGNTVNAFLQHRVSGGTGGFDRRTMSIEQA